MCCIKSEYMVPARGAPQYFLNNGGGAGHVWLTHETRLAGFSLRP